MQATTTRATLQAAEIICLLLHLHQALFCMWQGRLEYLLLPPYRLIFFYFLCSMHVRLPRQPSAVAAVVGKLVFQH